MQMRWCSFFRTPSVLLWDARTSWNLCLVLALTWVHDAEQMWPLNVDNCEVARIVILHNVHNAVSELPGLLVSGILKAETSNF